MNKQDLNKIKEAAEEFFRKMTVPVSKIDASADISGQEGKEVVELDVRSEEPQILIGQGGQTLFEIQRLLRLIVNKKLQNIFYLNLDINDYKKKKIEYLKEMAKELADQVSLAKEEKAFSPMPSYERRIVHAELSKRTDVATESRGNGHDRHVVVMPK